jgi:hypothetical protein
MDWSFNELGQIVPLIYAFGLNLKCTMRTLPELNPTATLAPKNTQIPSPLHPHPCNIHRITDILQ